MGSKVILDSILLWLKNTLLDVDLQSREPILDESFDVNASYNNIYDKWVENIVEVVMLLLFLRLKLTMMRSIVLTYCIIVL
jgi:hypothetical protein